MNKTQKADKAYKLYDEIKRAKADETLRLLLLGEDFKDIRDSKKWKDLGYESFEAFCAEPEIGRSKDTIEGLIEVYEIYVYQIGVTMSVLQNIGYRRLQLLTPLIEKEPSKYNEWLSRALTWSNKDLINAVRKAKGRDSMPKTSFQNSSGDIPTSYIKYVESCPCLLCARKSIKAHWPRTSKMGGKLVIPLCHICHMQLHQTGIDTFFALYKVEIGQWLEQMIKDLIGGKE